MPCLWAWIVKVVPPRPGRGGKRRNRASVVPGARQAAGPDAAPGRQGRPYVLSAAPGGADTAGIVDSLAAVTHRGRPPWATCGTKKGIAARSGPFCCCHRRTWAGQERTHCRRMPGSRAGPAPRALPARSVRFLCRPYHRSLRPRHGSRALAAPVAPCTVRLVPLPPEALRHGPRVDAPSVRRRHRSTLQPSRYKLARKRHSAALAVFGVAAGSRARCGPTAAGRVLRCRRRGAAAGPAAH